MDTLTKLNAIAPFFKESLKESVVSRRNIVSGLFNVISFVQSVIDELNQLRDDEPDEWDDSSREHKIKRSHSEASSPLYMIANQLLTDLERVEIENMNPLEFKFLVAKTEVFLIQIEKSYNSFINSIKTKGFEEMCFGYNFESSNNYSLSQVEGLLGFYSAIILKMTENKFTVLIHKDKDKAAFYTTLYRKRCNSAGRHY